MKDSERTPVESITAHIHERLAGDADKHRERAHGLMELLREKELHFSNPLESTPRKASMLRALRTVFAFSDYRLSRWQVDPNTDRMVDTTVTIQQKAQEQLEFFALISLTVAVLDGM